MIRMIACGVIMAVGVWSGSAAAQDAAPAQRPADSFAGVYVGGEAGVVDHHFVVENPGPGTDDGIHRRGLGVGGFAGYQAAIGRRLLLGAEVAYFDGGRTPTFRSGATFASLAPRWGYSITGRAGVAVSRRASLFAEAGYGGHRYRIESTALIDTSEIGNWTRSFVLGAGAEYRLSDHAGLRLRFQHLDGTRNQLLIGLPLRF